MGGSLAILTAAVISAGLAACGGDGDTTVINKTVAPDTTAQDATAPAAGTVEPPQPRVLVANEFRPEGGFCPTLRACFESVKWPTYTADRAVGLGSGEVCDMTGACSQYTDEEMIFTDPARACGRLQFSKLEMLGNEFKLRADIGCTEYAAF